MHGLLYNTKGDSEECYSASFLNNFPSLTWGEFKRSVKRDTWDDYDIRVEEVVYRSSQPWPRVYLLSKGTSSSDLKYGLAVISQICSHLCQLLSFHL